MLPPILNLPTFIECLRKEKELVEIFEEVDPDLEIAEIHRRVAAADGPALFFHNVKGSRFPVVTNLFGSIKRIDIAFQNRPDQVVADLVSLLTKEFPPTLNVLWKKRALLKKLFSVGTKTKRKGPIIEEEQATVDLEKLPFLKSWPLDGGSFITLPLVYTQPPEQHGGGSPNLGMYRIQRFDKQTLGLHFQIGKGGGFHYHLAEESNQPLPVAIFIGGPPGLILSAITPLPENLSELLIASLMQGKKLQLTKIKDFPYPLISECEFAILGEALPHQRKPEGPFGDHYGYYSLKHDFPFLNVKKIFHRKNAIYPATIVGKPKQEDFYIGDYLQKLLSPLFPVVMPGVKALWSYGETGFHSLAAAVVKERYYRECMSSCFRILGEGQLSFTKFLLATDQNVNLQNFKETLTTVLERFDPRSDLFIFSNLSMDTLDYTGPELNKGSRGILLGIGEKKRDLATAFRGSLHGAITDAALFSPGCLVLEAPPFVSFKDFEGIINHSDFRNFPLLILVDNLKKTMKNTESFLWTTFTRFEPAADIHAKCSLYRHHLCYEPPILIDARMKPTYPEEVLPDEKTADLVAQKWNSYFPKGLAMGDSFKGHVS